MENLIKNLTKRQIAEGYYADEEDQIICTQCGEHASKLYMIIMDDEDKKVQDLEEIGSECCG